MLEYGDTLDVPATEKHVATVILCHGMDDSAQRWKESILRWGWDNTFPHIKFSFPQAPIQPVTFLDDTSMSAWFNVLTTNDVEGGKYDKDGIVESQHYLEHMIEAEVKRGIPLAQIFLGGYSQGGALALYTGVASKHMLGGVFAISSYMPMLPDVKSSLATRDTPSCEKQRPKIFISHGTNDQMVKYPWAEWTVNCLQAADYDVHFKTYLRGGHMMQAYTRIDLQEWLRAQIPYDIAYEIYG